MAAPERIKNNNVFPVTDEICSPDPTIHTIIQENRRTTIVRTAVATFESVFRIPLLAKIEVSPAKKADPIA